MVVERLTDELAPLAEQGSVPLPNEVPDNAVAKFDPMMLERVLQNIVSNAIAAAAQGWVKIHAAEQSAQHWSVTVSNWPGLVTDAQLAKLTGKRESSLVDAQSPGHGLGILRELCLANNAQISGSQTSKRESQSQFQAFSPIRIVRNRTALVFHPSANGRMFRLNNQN